MKDISQFFEKFKHILKTDGAQKQIVIEALEREIGVRMDPSKITIKNGIASVSASPIVKSEIYLKKQKIMDGMKGSGGTLSDIK